MGLARQKVAVGVGLGLLLVVLVGFSALSALTGGRPAYRTAQPRPTSLVFPALVVVVAVSLAAGLLLGRARRRQALARYSAAMQGEGPGAMLAVIEASGRGRQAEVIPDFDAVLAHERAFIFALYGREAEARAALEGVDWTSRSPALQAVHASTGALIDCLCSRRYGRALRDARWASSAAPPSAAPHGAGFHQTVVDLAEALLGHRSLAAERKLPPGQPPLLRLVTAYARWVAKERADDAAGAAPFRALLDAEAPHCRPLQVAPRENNAE